MFNSYVKLPEGTPFVAIFMEKLIFQSMGFWEILGYSMLGQTMAKPYRQYRQSPTAGNCTAGSIFLSNKWCPLEGKNDAEQTKGLHWKLAIG